jgi:hypothetical protein
VKLPEFAPPEPLDAVLLAAADAFCDGELVAAAVVELPVLGADVVLCGEPDAAVGDPTDVATGDPAADPVAAGAFEPPELQAVKPAPVATTAASRNDARRKFILISPK